MKDLSYWNNEKCRFEFKKNILSSKKFIEFLMEILIKKNSDFNQNLKFHEEITYEIYNQFVDMENKISAEKESKKFIFTPNKKEYILKLSEIIREISNVWKHSKFSFLSFLSSKGNYIHSDYEIKISESIEREVSFLVQIKDPIEWFSRFLDKFIFDDWHNNKNVDKYLIDHFEIMRIDSSNKEWNVNLSNFPVDKKSFRFIKNLYESGDYRQSMAKARQLLGKYIGFLNGDNKKEDFKYFAKKSNLVIYKHADNILKEITSIRHYVEKINIEDKDFENLQEKEKMIVSKFVIESVNLLKSLVDVNENIFKGEANE